MSSAKCEVEYEVLSGSVEREGWSMECGVWSAKCGV